MISLLTGFFFGRIIGNFTSTERSSECRSLVFDRSSPSTRIGVNGRRELLFNSGLLLFKAVMSSANVLFCVFLKISVSTLRNSAGDSSPNSQWLSGRLQFSMNRCTQPLTRTNDNPNSNCPFGLSRYHLEYLDGSKRHSPSLSST